MSSNILTKDGFFSSLASYPDADKYWIACSGGMDSSVLLHLFYLNSPRLKQPVEVVYVDHRLQQQSKEWGSFCGLLCQQYDFSFSSLEIDEEYKNGFSIEEWAREKRYELLADMMNENDILFTAHHQDDQVETFFLHAFRGSGPRGLVAMPGIRKFSNGFHARPLLSCTRKELQRYANEHQLSWKTDPSNDNIRYDRNYLRKSVLPVIEERWPAFRITIARLVRHQQEVKSLLDEIADNDLKQAITEKTYVINIDAINDYSNARKKNLIAYWLKKLDMNLPASRHLNQIITDVLDSEPDKAPCVNWHGVEIRRYRNMLYAMNSLLEHDQSIHYVWKINQPFQLSEESLVASSSKGQGILKECIENQTVEIRYRQGGEKIRPENQSMTKSVKQLFQEKGVLPWHRDRIPLIYIDDQLALIPGICVDEKFCAKENEAAWDIRWSGLDKVIQQ